MLPNDPVILLSVLNTKLRDFHVNLSDLCDNEDIDEAEITDKMKSAGYVYDNKSNQFKAR